MKPQITLDQLRFHILPSSNPPTQKRSLHDNAYRLWSEVWTQTFAKLGIDKSALTGEFARQDLIACIAQDDQPLAIHLYSFYAIDSLASREHPYMRDNYPELYFARLAKAGVRTAMSMEYMTVHPDFRKGLSNVHLGIVLAGLAFTTMKNFGADAAIAPARRDHKVHELAYAFGSEPVIAKVTNHNVECDLVMCHRDKVKAHESPEVQALVESLWKGREYHPNCQPSEVERAVIPLRRVA